MNKYSVGTLKDQDFRKQTLCCIPRWTSDSSVVKYSSCEAALVNNSKVKWTLNRNGFLPQFPSQYLPHIRLRKFFNKLNELRSFVTRKILFTELFQLLFR
jgi:hypothetical protein